MADGRVVEAGAEGVGCEGWGAADAGDDDVDEAAAGGVGVFTLERSAHGGFILDVAVDRGQVGRAGCGRDVAVSEELFEFRRCADD